MTRAAVRRVLVGLTFGAAGALVLPVGSAVAFPGPGAGSGPGSGPGPGFRSTVYVSPNGVAGAHGFSCATAAFDSLQAAVEAAPVHGTVVVCPGTYQQSVTLDKPVSLDGRPGSVIDATGQIYGVGAAAANSTVTGLTVENANSTATGALDDGIVTGGIVDGSLVSANHITIANDTVENNVGSGIDINSTSYSTAANNRSFGNGVGINVSNDVGVPASHNTIVGNVSDDNPGGCGIVLADHTGVGVFDNLVLANVADDNGLGTPSAPDASAGSGIILAGSAGGVYDNTITSNSFSGNGHAGVALHAHAPGLNFSGNVITFNRIGTNNLRTDTGDSETTGIYLGDASPLSITVKDNVIWNNYYGIFTAGTVTVFGARRNLFLHVTTPLGNISSY
jgi:nitrous oxidase accessory protein NosD